MVDFARKLRSPQPRPDRAPSAPTLKSDEIKVVIHPDLLPLVGTKPFVVAVSQAMLNAAMGPNNALYLQPEGSPGTVPGLLFSPAKNTLKVDFGVDDLLSFQPEKQEEKRRRPPPPGRKKKKRKGPR